MNVCSASLRVRHGILSSHIAMQFYKYEIDDNDEFTALYCAIYKSNTNKTIIFILEVLCRLKCVCKYLKELY